MRITGEDIAAMEDRYRVFFVNSLSGFKSANLIGTVDPSGVHNLSMVSSVVHVGANPPLMAMVSRPNTVRRDTLENIHATGVFTVNHVHEDFLEAAHQTAARYGPGESEFDRVGLTPEPGDSVAAPYVAGSPLQIGLEHRQTVDLDINGCHLVIGEIVEVRVDEAFIGADGAVDLGQAGSIVVSGLDHYYGTRPIARLSYAKPDRAPTRLNPRNAP
jgi:flavin reductase (DIM6/NTAB) family NADH-FMN oxidoreductase RutF